MNILYITFIDFGDFKSGSTVRPQKMYDAFIEAGHTVKLLECRQNRYKLRWKRVWEIMKWLENHHPDICYIEPATGPFFNYIDLWLLTKVHKMGIPIGLFYRDAYWLYDDQWPIGKAKAFILRIMHRRDLRYFRRCCDIVYYPSRSMADLFVPWKLKRLGVLPPACDSAQPSHTQIHHRAIYVGEIRGAAGADILLSAFQKVNAHSVKVELCLVCREAELARNQLNAQDFPWLRVVHAQGDELKALYESADVGIIPRHKDFYMNFAVPVKLFEYLGYGLPVIVTNCNEMASLVSEQQCGLVCEDNADALAAAIEQFYDEKTDRAALMAAAHHTAQENRWIDRANQVVEDLSR